MKLSKKAEYALRAVTAMSRAPVGTTFSIQDVASSERVPLKVLEQILVVLKNAGILRSRRGVGGGYQLVIPPMQIRLRDVIQPFDGPFMPLSCTTAATASKSTCECGVSGGCSLSKTFAGLQSHAEEWLAKTTIADVLANDPPSAVVSFEI